MVKIRRKIDSETLHLPELRPLIGKLVEITIEEGAVSEVKPGMDNWDAAMKAALDLEDYDFDAYVRQHEYDVQHARDHLA